MRSDAPASIGSAIDGSAALLPLASGALSPEQAAELDALTRQIDLATGLSLSRYKEACFRRRVAVRMRATGATSYPEYGGVLQANPAEYGRLLAAVTINVSRFFRNRDVWREVAELVLPELVGRDDPFLNLWSAGCAAGEEAYTLAMLLDELDRLRPGSGSHRFRLVATDVDPDALDAARAAAYPDLGLAETTDEDRARWFEVGGPPHRPVDRIRRKAAFWHLDLLADRYPRGQHLICCRNVIMYFDAESQAAILEGLHKALVPGGFLVLGRAESLVGAAVTLYETVSVPLRVYRRGP